MGRHPDQREVQRRRDRNDRVLWAAVGCTFVACFVYAMLASVGGQSQLTAALSAIAVFIIGVAGAWLVLTREMQRDRARELQGSAAAGDEPTA